MKATHQINDGGPAEDMSLRAYAAIKLCVPESGIDWLDDMIRKAQRDWLAGQALQGIISNADLSRHLISKTIGHVESGHDKIAAHAYAFADATAAHSNQPAN